MNWPDWWFKLANVKGTGFGPLPTTARQTYWLVLMPMLATFVCQRSYLHLVHVRHVYPGGYLVHHLFFGVLLVIPAAFLLAFAPAHPVAARLARVVLGIGTAMVLDEIVYLVMTGASDQDYVSAVSLSGALIFMAVGVALLTVIYWLNRE